MSFTPLMGIAGTQLHGEALVPPRSSAALLIIHGIAEHGGRYRAAMQAIASREVACFAYDQRGHGKSPGERADVERFSLLVEDAVEIARDIRLRNPERPLVVWGHSMGSLVALLAASSLGRELNGVITSGCPVDAFARTLRWLSSPLQQLSRAMPRFRLSGIFKASDLSHDLTVQRAYESDPLVEHSMTLRLMAGIAAACQQARDVAPSLTLPWLAMHGEEDRIAPPRGSQHLVELLGSQDKQLILYEGSRHEVHNEVEPARTQFLDTIAQWIAKHHMS